MLMAHQQGKRFLRVSLPLALIALLIVVANADELPLASQHNKPIEFQHFPNSLYAVVWRNWGLVEPQRLADVLNTSSEKVTDLAVSMGLSRDVQVPSHIKQRGYLTLIRRNWHLLPYEQLTQLLDMTPEQLGFILREDDSLYIKLGSLKPKCSPISYVELLPEARQRASEIKQLVQKHFGQGVNELVEPPFSFIASFTKTDNRHLEAESEKDKSDAKPLRFIYSYFALFGDSLSDPGLDPYPDGLLARLREQGVNGVWLHVVLRQLAPGGPEFPEWGEGHERRLANLRKLVERAKRYGIDVYLYMNEPRAMPKSFFASRPEMVGAPEDDFAAVCTTDVRVRKWLSNSLAHVFREVPGLGGIFAITASENLTNCASHGRQVDCPRCKHRPKSDIISEVIRAMEEGVHAAAPDAKVIVWDWGWQPWVRSSDPTTSNSESTTGNDVLPSDAVQIVPKLPSSLWLMSVSEWSQPIVRGGFHSKVGEYSMSAIGPGPRATHLWELATRHGHKKLAKVQVSATWELSSVPYLPVMDLVAQHCSRLAEAGVDGLMLSWSVGGYPSPNLELANMFSYRPASTIDVALQQLAEKHFGKTAAPHVRNAWTKFSRAFQEFPLNIRVLYKGPQQLGPANLLYATSTDNSAGVVVCPYDDLQSWCGPYRTDTYVAQFKKMADGWAEGLMDLEAAQRSVPDSLKSEAAADLRVARAAQIHFASTANQGNFIIARDRFHSLNDSHEREQLRRLLIELLNDEIRIAKQLHALTCVDSRLGFEASKHYYYFPNDLIEKVMNCIHLREHFASIR